MEERRAIGLFKRSPRPKWRELTGAMKSLTVARDFQKFTKKNVGSRAKAGRTATNSTTRSSSKTSSWMTSSDEDDDDFVELSDFEIDEEECEKSRFSDAFISESTDIFPDLLPDKEPKDWDEDPVPVLTFDSAIKSTPIENKQEPEEILSGLRNFKHGILASSTPKTNRFKSLRLENESDSKLPLDLEGNIFPKHLENTALDLRANLFDDSHKDVEIPEISMSIENNLLNNSNSPNTLSRQHETICSTSKSKTEELNKESGPGLQSVPPCSNLVPYSLDSTIQDIEILESVIYDAKGDPCNISNLLNNTSHLDETVCSKTVPEQCAEPSKIDSPTVDKNLNLIKSEEKDSESIFSINSGKLDEAPTTGDSSSFLNKTSVSIDEKRKNLQNISISMLSKLPKLGRRLAFRRRKETDLPKKVILE